MGLFNHEEYNEYQNVVADKSQHKAKLSHELIAAAASYEAAKAYEKHVEETGGKPPSHAKAKEIFAGFAGAFIDKEFETHGLNLIDREKAKYEAHKHAEKYLPPASDY